MEANENMAPQAPAFEQDIVDTQESLQNMLITHLKKQWDYP